MIHFTPVGMDRPDCGETLQEGDSLTNHHSSITCPRCLVRRAAVREEQQKASQKEIEKARRFYAFTPGNHYRIASKMRDENLRGRRVVFLGFHHAGFHDVVRAMVRIVNLEDHDQVYYVLPSLIIPDR